MLCCLVFWVESVWLIVYFVLVWNCCYKDLYCEGVSIVFLGVMLGYVEDVRGLEVVEFFWDELLLLELVINDNNVFLMLFLGVLGFSCKVVMIVSILSVFIFVVLVMVWMLCFLFYIWGSELVLWLNMLLNWFFICMRVWDVFLCVFFFIILWEYLDRFVMILFFFFWVGLNLVSVVVIFFVIFFVLFFMSFWMDGYVFVGVVFRSVDMGFLMLFFMCFCYLDFSCCSFLVCKDCVWVLMLWVSFFFVLDGF